MSVKCSFEAFKARLHQLPSCRKQEVQADSYLLSKKRWDPTSPGSGSGSVLVKLWIGVARLVLLQCPPVKPVHPVCAVCLQMYYYRYDNPEVSCCYKYLMFSYNIIFWVSHLTRWTRQNQNLLASCCHAETRK